MIAQPLEVMVIDQVIVKSSCVVTLFCWAFSFLIIVCSPVDKWSTEVSQSCWHWSLCFQFHNMGVVGHFWCKDRWRARVGMNSKTYLLLTDGQGSDLPRYAWLSHGPMAMHKRRGTSLLFYMPNNHSYKVSFLTPLPISSQQCWQRTANGHFME